MALNPPVNEGQVRFLLNEKCKDYVTNADLEKQLQSYVPLATVDAAVATVVY